MSFEYLVTVGIIFIIGLLVIVFLSPGEKKKRVKKQDTPVESTDAEKELQLRVTKLKKHIQAYRNENLDMKKREKEDEKQLIIERVKVKKIQEKLSQERQWRDKEQSGNDKKGKESRKLKSELVDVQENFSKAHAANLRFEHQLKESQDQQDLLNEQRRTAEGESAQLKAKIENNRQEISKLKKENTELLNKQENVKWVAKDEHERVEKLLKEKEKELEKIKKKREQ